MRKLTKAERLAGLSRRQLKRAKGHGIVPSANIKNASAESLFRRRKGFSNSPVVPGGLPGLGK